MWSRGTSMVKYKKSKVNGNGTFKMDLSWLVLQRKLGQNNFDAYRNDATSTASLSLIFSKNIRNWQIVMKKLTALV
ncbi:unnamed protein product [Allacma fusca]|uniref:Uncharacterized protein n=1 Tax=Allacma fusca TaxID=39272 RepID=A0A8J2JLJ3_9HEXA|nr:unnamed protein product [Allacma fusca]